MTPRYRLGGQLVLRMTGFPVEELSAMSDPELAASVDADRQAEAEAEARRRALATALRAEGRELKKATEAVGRGRPLPGPLPGALAAAGARYDEDRVAGARRAEAQAARYEAALERSRRHLYATVRGDRFRHALLLSSPDFEAQLDRDVSAERARNSSIRKLEATLVAYVQRFTTKNETISFFGPSVWGTVDPALPEAVAIDLDDREIDAQVLYFERWICSAIAERMAEDPDAAPFARLSRRPDVGLEEGGARLFAEERSIPLSAEERATLARADGTLRVNALPEALVTALVDKGLVTRGFALPATLTPFALLVAEVERWPAGPARERWQATLRELDARKAALAGADVETLRREVRALLARLGELGLSAQKSAQTLYAARLPVNHDCRRAARRVAVGQPFVEQATTDLAPWYELWRDLAGLYATRLHAKMKAVYDGTGGRPLPLAAYLRACDAARLPLHKTEGVGLMPEVEPELQRAWAEQIGDRADQREVTLTDDDLAFVRRRFSFRRMKNYDHPAPDFQVAASEADLAAGRFTLVLAELHPDSTLWQNALAMWCPDPAALEAEYLAAGYDRLVEYGVSYPHLPVHTSNIFVLERHPAVTFVGASLCEHCHVVRPTDILVEVTDDDALLRSTSGEPLGSLLHRWDTAFNTHRLQLLGDRTHAPRLKVGRVVVQREQWVLEPDDALHAALETPGHSVFAALRALRAAHELPEEVFVQPILPFKFAGHKEGKPTYVDFQSPLLVEQLASRVRGFRRLVVTEMLPSTRQCFLHDARGHYSCELRCSVRPVTP